MRYKEASMLREIGQTTCGRFGFGRPQAAAEPIRGTRGASENRG